MRSFLLVLSFLALSGVCRAQSSLKEQQFTVGGIGRVALITAPTSAASAPAPVVFGFHGHGGSMRHTSRSWGLHTTYPEAIVVYMQGLPTVGHLSDPEGKRRGWQKRVGESGDRDLKFFDAAFTHVKKQYSIDPRRVFAVGHSNGGAFTYLLSAERSETLAAVAVVGALDARSLRRLKPKPTLHVAGKKDPLVFFRWQERMMDGVRQVNGCDATGKPWAKAGDFTANWYPSAQGAPFVEIVHPGGHEFPSETVDLIARFFREVTSASSPGTRQAAAKSAGRTF